MTIGAFSQVQRASVNARTGRFSSAEFPDIRIKIDKNLKYLGTVPFDLENEVKGNRYVFAQHDDKNRINRAFIVQMEGFLPAATDTYKYKISTPASLGGHPYQHNVLIYNDDEDIRERPGHESELTKKFLESKGLSWGPELVMSRFARPVGVDKRHEIILFYFEDLKAYRHSLRDFNDNKNSDDAKRIKNAVETDSSQAFTVTADKD